jgi:hypothetical protein
MLIGHCKVKKSRYNLVSTKQECYREWEKERKREIKREREREREKERERERERERETVITHTNVQQ